MIGLAMGMSTIVQKGRSALSNPEGRFETVRKESEHDGWDRLPDPEDEPAPIETIVKADPTRSIITRNQSPDIPFNQSINPYKGCEHVIWGAILFTVRGDGVPGNLPSASCGEAA